MATTEQTPKTSEETVNANAPEETTASYSPAFPIVGIGASAGGLAAFEEFFSGMPAGDSGMAFVLVQHLAPDHQSILADLVRRYTRMEVFEVTQGMIVKPNCAYVIPPNRNMALVKGALQLMEQEAPRSQHLAIDFFFRSLAEDQHERAICIVLSGTGGDGTQGIRAVKAEGGMAIAQDPASTEYDGMPSSAIDTGLVDYVLQPREMASQVIAYAAHAPGNKPRPVPVSGAPADASLKKIFELLRVQTSHDFSHYKLNTITRCIERRMAVHQIGQMDEYASYLERTSADVEALFRDLLIGVTSFFRDADAFEAILQQAVPRLFEGRSADSQIRIWVPACSTGEEAYSLAILLHERLEDLKLSFKLQVFATDIDHQAIECARAGVYPASIAVDISPARLERFLIQEPDGSAFRICKSVRDSVIFSEQDIIRDPPFSKLDLISCRNLLIYMDGELQRKLIPLFHYALKPGGMLFLGSSESVGDFGELFATMDRKAKLYLRKEGAEGAQHAKFFPKAAQRPVPRPAAKALGERKLSVRDALERMMLQQYTPSGAVVNERGEILYLHGRTGDYLEPAQGEPAMNILKMAREGLRQELTTALHKAARSSDPVRREGVRIKSNGDFTTVDLTVGPVPADANPEEGNADPAPRLFLVVFEKVRAKPAPPGDASASVAGGGAGGGESTAEVDQRIAELTQALQAKEEYLQVTNEDLQSTNEALNFSNEEMQSLNEELQATNEELETSKEELQSVNEELATVNAELQTRVSDLSRSNNDLNNLLAGTGIGTIFVDGKMRIRNFTPAITQAINLLPADVGRPVGQIVSNLIGYVDLVADVQAVLDKLTNKEVEVQTQAGEWYLLRIRPYRTVDNAVDGAVITFTDITEVRKVRAERADSEALRRLATVVRDAGDAVTARDLDGRILAWNPAAQRIYGWSEAEALAMNFRDLVPESGREEELAAVRRQIQGEVVEPRAAGRIAKDGRIVQVLATSTALMNDAGEAYAIAATERATL
jgi:two-component system CheB/CheR fusion protein